MDLRPVYKYQSLLYLYILPVSLTVATEYCTVCTGGCKPYSVLVRVPARSRSNSRYIYSYQYCIVSTCTVPVYTVSLLCLYCTPYWVRSATRTVRVLPVNFKISCDHLRSKVHELRYALSSGVRLVRGRTSFVQEARTDELTSSYTACTYKKKGRASPTSSCN